MHATIDVRLTVSIDNDKTIPLATLAEFIGRVAKSSRVQ